MRVGLCNQQYLHMSGVSVRLTTAMILVIPAHDHPMRLKTTPHYNARITSNVGTSPNPAHLLTTDRHRSATSWPNATMSSSSSPLLHPTTTSQFVTAVALQALELHNMLHQHSVKLLTGLPVSVVSAARRLQPNIWCCQPAAEGCVVHEETTFEWGMRRV